MKSRLRSRDLLQDAERLLLSIEHAAAASSSGIELVLGERGGGLTLHVRKGMSRHRSRAAAPRSERLFKSTGIRRISSAELELSS